MIHAVRCPSCLNLSRVETEDLGRTVECPLCGRPFSAVDESTPTAPSTPPTVRPNRGWNPSSPPPPVIPVVPDRVEPPIAEDPFAEDASSELPSGAVVGLALLPWGIPMLWLLLPMITGKDPIFSFAAPMAIAVGACGLEFGVAFTAKWSQSTRMKAVLAISILGYATGGLMFAVKKEWVEGIRRHFGRGELVWRPFVPPDGKYEVKFPGPARQVSTPLLGWNLVAFQFQDEAHQTLDVFVVAHGKAPIDLPNQQGKPPADPEWFEAAKKAVIESSGGAMLQNERPLTQRGHHGREYVLGLPDGVTNRIVRVFRVRAARNENIAYYLAAEGPFLAQSAPDVQTFFGSFSPR